MATGKITPHVENVTEISPEELKKGDQICTPLFQGVPGVYHHGIYIGGGEVVDFGGDVKTKADIRRVTVEEFLSGRDKLYRVNYSCGTESPEVVVRNAFTLMENPHLWKQYNLASNNCEHFATYCKTGRHYSAQVVRAINISIAAVVGIAAVGLAAWGIGKLIDYVEKKREEKEKEEENKASSYAYV